LSKWEVFCGDCLEVMRGLPDKHVQCVVTSPPYWGLRDYGVDGQLGLERTPEEYIEKMVAIFREVRRVLKDDGVLWLNLGDSYINNSIPGGGDPTIGKRNIGDSKYRANKVDNLKPKDLCGIPWRVALALQADGWWLRQDIIWHKPNPMPESVTDRCTKSHEYIFLLSKSAKYYYDADAVRDNQLQSSLDRMKRGWNGDGMRDYPGGVQNHIKDYMGKSKEEIDGLKGSNKRSVWSITTKPFSEWGQTSHLARVEQGASYDDMMRIVSPNCPHHGGLFDLLPNDVCGEHEDDPLTRKQHNNNYPSQEQLSERDYIEMLRAYCFLGDSWDLFDRKYALTAKHHNNQNSKTGPGPSTNLSCKPYAQRLSRILRTLISHGLSEIVLNIYENNIWPDEMAFHLLDQTIYRNVGKSSFGTPPDCICGLYHKTTKKTSHFATFPPEIPEICIKAGSKQADTILDPFSGAGTTGLVACRLFRNYIGVELNPEYIKLSERRIRDDMGLFV